MKKFEKMLSFLQESRLLVETDSLSRDFEPLRQAIRDAVGRDFGVMVVEPRFQIGENPSAALVVKCKGFGKMIAQEFRGLAEPAIVEIFRGKRSVKVRKNYVEWTLFFDLRD